VEELLEEDPVGFDSHKSFAEMDKDGNMEYSVGIKIQVLNTVVHETFEEVVGWNC
jgi:hypothetical protein